MRRRVGGRGGGHGVEGGGKGGEGAGALEIEFEDGDEPPDRVASAGGRPRDLRAAALVALAVVTLGAALSATHRTSSSGTSNTNSVIVSAAAPDYAASMVTVQYRDAHVDSLQQRRIVVDLLLTPAPGAQVRVLNYYVDENGIVSSADTELSGRPLPGSGMNVRLELTVADCALAPIGESMSFVNVLAVGPAGTTDRFTILGERYSLDLARLLRAVCPARNTASGADAASQTAGGA